MAIVRAEDHRHHPGGVAIQARHYQATISSKRRKLKPVELIGLAFFCLNKMPHYRSDYSQRRPRSQDGVPWEWESIN